jgi:hypothetical protein
MLIFSKKLLKQQNYHINIQDYNGHINEENTYYPWNLDKAIDAIKSDKYKRINEVVFHDSIPMKYLCAAIISYKNSYTILSNNETLTSNYLLPNFPIFNDEDPDMTKMPFYCYPYEMNYSGTDPFKISSDKFYIKMDYKVGDKKTKVNNYRIKEIIKSIKLRKYYKFKLK